MKASNKPASLENMKRKPLRRTNIVSDQLVDICGAFCCYEKFIFTAGVGGDPIKAKTKLRVTYFQVETQTQ